MDVTLQGLEHGRYAAARKGCQLVAKHGLAIYVRVYRSLYKHRVVGIYKSRDSLKSSAP